MTQLNAKTLDEITFRASDTAPTRLQKLEFMRRWLITALAGLADPDLNLGTAAYLDWSGDVDFTTPTNDDLPTTLAVYTFVLAKIAGIDIPAVDLSGLLVKAANLSDVANAALARANLLAAPLYLPVTNDAGAAYTFDLPDAYTHQRFTSAAAVAATVPTNAAKAFPVGTRIRCTQAGAGQVTLTPAGGVTLNSADGSLKSRVQFSVFEIEKVAVNEWDVLGDVSV